LLFAPNSAWRVQVTPAKRGQPNSQRADKTPAERDAAMTWAKRLKRVFNIDIETSEHCGGEGKKAEGVNLGPTLEDVHHL
jgi:hypothetical protein